MPLRILVREGIVRLLEVDPSVEVIAACGSPAEAIEEVDRDRPDVVMTDIRMPPSQSDEGIKLASRLRETDPQVGVLVLSQHLTPEYAIGLLDDGSDGRGYLLKDRIADPDSVVRALRTVAAGGCHVDPLVVEELVAAREGRHSALDILSPREVEILADIAEGLSNQAIADRRVLSRRAVEKHASSIFSKLGLSGDTTANRRVRAALAYLAETTR